MEKIVKCINVAIAEGEKMSEASWKVKYAEKIEEARAVAVNAFYTANKLPDIITLPSSVREGILVKSHGESANTESASLVPVPALVFDRIDEKDKHSIVTGCTLGTEYRALSLADYIALNRSKADYDAYKAYCKAFAKVCEGIARNDYTVKAVNDALQAVFDEANEARDAEGKPYGCRADLNNEDIQHIRGLSFKSLKTFQNRYTVSFKQADAIASKMMVMAWNKLHITERKAKSK